MPLRIGDNAPPEDFFIVGSDDLGVPGIALLATQVLTVVSADPATVVFNLDAVARPTTKDFLAADGKTVLVPAGTVTQGSGKVSSAKPPAKPNVAINATVHVANQDGTPVLDDTGAPVADLVDTATVVPGLLKSEGMLFIA